MACPPAKCATFLGVSIPVSRIKRNISLIISSSLTGLSKSSSTEVNPKKLNIMKIWMNYSMNVTTFIQIITGIFNSRYGKGFSVARKLGDANKLVSLHCAVLAIIALFYPLPIFCFVSISISVSQSTGYTYLKYLSILVNTTIFRFSVSPTINISRNFHNNILYSAIRIMVAELQRTIRKCCVLVWFGKSVN